MEYIIVKYNKEYLLTTKEALQDYYKKSILVFDKSTKYKKTMLNIIKDDLKYKNKTELKTIILN